MKMLFLEDKLHQHLMEWIDHLNSFGNYPNHMEYLDWLIDFLH